jgi:hypothetical protein
LNVCVGGTLTVTWTATDACGNVGTATSTITVVPDTEDPIVTAPAGITLDCGDISETTDPCCHQQLAGKRHGFGQLRYRSDLDVQLRRDDA